MVLAEDARTVDYDEVEPQADFWKRHVHIGVSLYAVGALGVVVYALATPGGMHRPALLAIDGFSLVLSLTVIRWVGLRLVTTRWREQFFFAWSLTTVVFIGSAAAIDGGTHSPLSYLLVLPLMFAALAYAPRYVIWLALLAVACAAGIGSATPHPQVAATLIMVLATAIAGILTVGGASNRARLNQQLVEMAALDSMTGCLSRGAFNRRLAEEVDRARRYGRTFGLVMVDVDNLKRLNDTAGHRAGDEALRRGGLRAQGRGTSIGRGGPARRRRVRRASPRDRCPSRRDRARATSNGDLRGGSARAGDAQPGLDCVVGAVGLGGGNVLARRRRSLRRQARGSSAVGRLGPVDPAPAEHTVPHGVGGQLSAERRAAMNPSRAGT